MTTYLVEYTGDIATQLYAGVIRRDADVLATFDRTTWEGLMGLVAAALPRTDSAAHAEELSRDVVVELRRTTPRGIEVLSRLAPEAVQRLLQGERLDDVPTAHRVDCRSTAAPKTTRSRVEVAPETSPVEASGVWRAGHAALIDSFGDVVYVRAADLGGSFECPVCGRTSAADGVCRAGCAAAGLIREFVAGTARVDPAALLAAHPGAARFYFPRAWNPHASGWIPRGELADLIERWHREKETVTR